MERVERRYVLPFAAVVGQEKAKLALLVAAVNPAVGGVLLSGDKGTGKTTLVRALADLLPEVEVVADCPFSCNPRSPLEMCDACYERAANGELKVERRKMRVVDLPLSITVDRLVGTLDIKRALKEGVRALQPGLLAEANRNILYIDEVNLLEDYVADVLLDSAAMGWNVVEREGISVRHPARFILVGSMNPEEGELRPQILDRFGLFVSVEAPLDPKTRVEIVKRVEEFQSDPVSFMEKYRPLQEELRGRVVKAREALREVAVPDDLLELLAKTVVEMGIRTHRAEIITVRAAKALAALDGRKAVSLEDLKKAMELALPHRMKSRPFEEPPRPPISPPKGGGREGSPQGNEGGGRSDARGKEGGLDEQRGGRSGFAPLALGNREERFSAEEVKLEREGSLRLKDEAQQARGSRGVRTTVIDDPHGVPISYITPMREPHDVDLTATIVNAIMRGAQAVEGEDVRVRVRRARAKRLCAILLDSSGSMAAMRRIAIAKGIAMNFVRGAYVKRDELALICFKGFRSEVLAPPTRRYNDVLRLLDEVRTGGRTPLPSALYELAVMARAFKEKHRKAVVKGVIVTDGKANVALEGGVRGNVREEVERLCRALRRMGVKLEIYDTRPPGLMDPAPSFIDLMAELTGAEVHRV
jgi:magnesium chelatase subunit D